MRPISRIAFLVLLVAAALPATAHAGGWATVEVDNQPVGLSAGKPWRVELLVKAHGVTPVDGLSPSVRIDNGEGVVRTFRTKPAGKPGRYIAVVTYPSAGTWQTRLFDGYTDATPHRLAPVTMPAAGEGKSVMGTPAKKTESQPASVVPADDVAPAPVPEESGAPWPVIVAIALVALGFAAPILVLGIPRRRRRDGPAVPQQYLPTQ
jgi:hypothetical protein